MSNPFTIRPLEPATWNAFARLVEVNNGVYGGCWCMSFHPKDGGHTDDPEARRQAKHERVCAGTAHAALVFQGEDCVGWCQFGSPEELPRIKSRPAYDKGLVDLPDWRIACCFVGKGHRRKGVATAALSGALELIAALGGGRVEGYPEANGAVPASFMFNGALSTYERAGFVKHRKIAKHRWVVSVDVPPR